MQSVKLEYFIEKQQEKQYIYLPFEIPANVESFEVNYRYKGDYVNSRVTENEKNVIDVALLDQNGDDAGTRGSEIKGFYISPTASTDGFKRLEPVAGVWQLVLGAYQVKSEGVPFSAEITFHFKKRRWLKGDTHLHTTHSDGVLTREQLCKKAKSSGLDFIIFTDHNNNMVGENLPYLKNFTAIRGLELTSYNGHFNFWGLAKPYDGSFAVRTKEEFLKHNLEGRARGAVLSVNHPTCSHCPWLFGLDGIEYDCIEVWNGPMRKDNLKAVELWDSLLKAGKKVAAVGGSDYHKNYVIVDLFARPAMRVLSSSRSEKDILAALKNGNSVITASPNTTMIELTIGDANVGDSVKYTPDMSVNVKAFGLKRGHTLKLIDNEGELFCYTAKRKTNFESSIPLRGKGYVRAEIEYNKNLFAKLAHKLILHFMLPQESREPVPPFKYAITNAIYIE